MERVIPSDSTLVKYDNPVLVTTHEKKSKARSAGPASKKPVSGVAVAEAAVARRAAAGRGKPQIRRDVIGPMHLPQKLASGLPGLQQPGAAPLGPQQQQPPLPSGAATVPGLLRQGPGGEAHHETDEILSAILPPREWEEDGQLWRQSVSNTPATRLDVINLQEQLDMRLQQRQARETGICPVRRQLYTQCFDELIRQVTINCAERGLMLLRVRDEIRMTIAAYQTLYESSIAFGMRKALMSEQGKADLEATVGLLVKQKGELERQVVELRSKTEQIERRAKELQQAEEKKHTEEIEFFKRTNQQLKSQLEGILAPKK